MDRKVKCSLVVFAIIASGACAGRGQEVFVREGCVHCHRFRTIGGGGAPDLSEVGSRRDAAWIKTKIVKPAAHDPESRMPPFPRIDWLDLRSLVAFLRS